MGYVYVIFASLLATTVNFCLRKNGEKQKSAGGYLTLYFISSFVISVTTAGIAFDNFRPVIPTVALIAGILNFLMMGLLALALRKGSSGLTFSFQNSASIFPSLVLFLIFGSAFGFSMNVYILFGFCLLITGLFLSARNQNVKPVQKTSFMKWLILAVAIFFIQGLILTLFQWRCLLFSDQVQDHPMIPWKCLVNEDAWFLPTFFIFPAIVQTFLFFNSERRLFTLRETFLGLTGGLLNGGSTFFLLLATQHASSGEKMVLFPLFAVSVIFLCNLWGKFIYKEKIYWPGMLLCLAGVFISSVATSL